MDPSDAIGIAVATTTSPEPVLTGAAILGALASRAFTDVSGAMSAMSELGDVLDPRARQLALHDARFAVFEALQAAVRKR